MRWYTTIWGKTKVNIIDPMFPFRILWGIQSFVEELLVNLQVSWPRKNPATTRENPPENRAEKWSEINNSYGPKVKKFHFVKRIYKAIYKGYNLPQLVGAHLVVIAVVKDMMIGSCWCTVTVVHHKRWTCFVLPLSLLKHLLKSRPISCSKHGTFMSPGFFIREKVVSNKRSDEQCRVV